MQPKEYVPWLYQQMAQAVVKAWESRTKGAVAWGLGQAVVGHNRRVVYSDGTANMVGPEGAQVLVEQTVHAIEELWRK